MQAAVQQLFYSNPGAPQLLLFKAGEGITTPGRLVTFAEVTARGAQAL